eukprot:Rmarinus@m.9589
MGGAFILGACLNLAGSIAINFGTNVMKLAHVKNEARAADGAGRSPIALSTIWQAGAACFFIGNIMNFVSFGYGPQSTLSALGSVQFVSNVVFCAVVHKTEVTFRSIISTFVIVAGNVMIVWAGSKHTEVYNSDQLKELYTERAYVTWLVVLLALVTTFQICYDTVDKAVKASRPMPAFVRNVCYPLFYAGVSGMVGSHAVLFAKCSSQMLRATWSGENQFGKGFFYVVLFAFGSTSFFWLRRMNTALRKFDALLIPPMMQVFWTLFSILSGGIYFQEFATFSAQQSVAFFTGVVVMLCGACSLRASEKTDTVTMGPGDMVAEEVELLDGDAGLSDTSSFDDQDIESTGSEYYRSKSEVVEGLSSSSAAVERVATSPQLGPTSGERTLRELGIV